ncbi:hypothetical protein [Neisseria chenwenguii]|uniref:hypothetical protein n=1 Tax=Neisseria chenwenguii TaxID=1853278 RepID=UPI000F4EB9E1|nr:hypothetical protein [Neisseria chenwenguii]ROV57130.1 hypothetical protein EGS38_00055 [Neisseria chenwenguii]
MKTEVIKSIVFHISAFGLCDKCDSHPLFAEELPENWEKMSDDEKEDWAKEVFWENIQWGWEEREYEVEEA